MWVTVNAGTGENMGICRPACGMSAAAAQVTRWRRAVAIAEGCDVAP
jgi:hypothetical protein